MKRRLQYIIFELHIFNDVVLVQNVNLRNIISIQYKETTRECNRSMKALYPFQTLSLSFVDDNLLINRLYIIS